MLVGGSVTETGSELRVAARPLFSPTARIVQNAARCCYLGSGACRMSPRVKARNVQNGVSPRPVV